jgi:hypothetical protein
MVISERPAGKRLFLYLLKGNQLWRGESSYSSEDA